MYTEADELTRDDMRAILAIAERASAMATAHGAHYPVMDASLDLAACHRRRPLRLAELAGARDGDFSHDVFGIRRHLDRETGRLMDCFVPRFAQR